MALAQRLELADLLTKRRTLVGAAITLRDQELAEITCAPWDFVMIDMEHSPIGLGDLPGILIAAKAAGTFGLVRIPSSTTEHLAAILDAGPAGVIVPQVESAAQAAELVSRLRFPPHGSRGWGPRRTAVVPGLRPGAGTPADRVVCIVLIESVAGIAAANEVARIDGVDALILGASDLSVDAGMPMQFDNDWMRNAIRTVQDAADAAGIASGLAGVTPRELLVELCASRSTIVIGAADARSHALAMSQSATGLRKLLDARSESVPSI